MGWGSPDAGGGELGSSVPVVSPPFLVRPYQWGYPSFDPSQPPLTSSHGRGSTLDDCASWRGAVVEGDAPITAAPLMRSPPLAGPFPPPPVPFPLAVLEHGQERQQRQERPRQPQHHQHWLLQDSSPLQDPAQLRDPSSGSRVTTLSGGVSGRLGKRARVKDADPAEGGSGAVLPRATERAREREEEAGEEGQVGRKTRRGGTGRIQLDEFAHGSAEGQAHLQGQGHVEGQGLHQNSLCQGVFHERNSLCLGAGLEGQTDGESQARLGQWRPDGAGFVDNELGATSGRGRFYRGLLQSSEGEGSLAASGLASVSSTPGAPSVAPLEKGCAVLAESRRTQRVRVARGKRKESDAHHALSSAEKDFSALLKAQRTKTEANVGAQRTERLESCAGVGAAACAGSARPEASGGPEASGSRPGQGDGSFRIPRKRSRGEQERMFLPAPGHTSQGEASGGENANRGSEAQRTLRQVSDVLRSLENDNDRTFRKTRALPRLDSAGPSSLSNADSRSADVLALPGLGCKSSSAEASIAMRMGAGGSASFPLLSQALSRTSSLMTSTSVAGGGDLSAGIPVACGSLGASSAAVCPSASCASALGQVAQPLHGPLFDQFRRVGEEAIGPQGPAQCAVEVERSCRMGFPGSSGSDEEPAPQFVLSSGRALTAIGRQKKEATIDDEFESYFEKLLL